MTWLLDTTSSCGSDASDAVPGLCGGRGTSCVSCVSHSALLLVASLILSSTPSLSEIVTKYIEFNYSMGLALIVT